MILGSFRHRTFHFPEMKIRIPTLQQTMDVSYPVGEVPMIHFKILQHYFPPTFIVEPLKPLSYGKLLRERELVKT